MGSLKPHFNLDQRLEVNLLAIKSYELTNETTFSSVSRAKFAQVSFESLAGARRI
jgi:hypothetical protein